MGDIAAVSDAIFQLSNYRISLSADPPLPLLLGGGSRGV